jgi:hypothetical protein
MCDRVAAWPRGRVWARVHDARGRPVARSSWDFKDLHGFVEAAPKVPGRHTLRRQRAGISR